MQQISARLYAQIKAFASQAQFAQESMTYFTLPDERFDVSLAAFRVYGDRGLYMVIAAAAGLDSVEQEMPEQKLRLPSLAQLAAMQAEMGTAW